MIRTDEDDEFERIERENKMKGQPYYFAPQRTWVGLTDEDFYGQSELQVMAMKYAEAKLKEKNHG